jgi:hypothetical protein
MTKPKRKGYVENFFIEDNDDNDDNNNKSIIRSKEEKEAGSTKAKYKTKKTMGSSSYK